MDKEKFACMGLGAILWVTGFFLLSRFPFGRPIWWLPDGSAMVAGMAAGAGFLLMIAVLVATVRKNPKMPGWGVFPICLGVYLALQIAGENSNMVANRFQNTVALRGLAANWIQREHNQWGDDSRVKLPEILARLSLGREARVDASGADVYVFFPHYDLIDSSEGLVYSQTGRPPDKDSFGKVNRAERLDRHWFWITTT